MAGVTKVNGKYHTEELVHRDLFFKAVTPATTAQADFDAAMQEIHLTSTIEVIGEYVAGATATINIVISGADVTALPDSGATIADIAGF